MKNKIDFSGSMASSSWGIDIIKFNNLSKLSILKIKNWFLEVNKNHPTDQELKTILKNDMREDYWN